MTSSVSRLDATALKVLAHPLRARLLSALRREGPATATELAAELGTNSGATSYHLRRLADVGLVRDTGRGEGRRREWESAAEVTSWAPSDFEPDDEDAQVALDWLEHTYFRQFVQRYESWLEHRGQWPAGWQDAAGADDHVVLVNAAELRALREEIWDVLLRHAAPAAATSDRDQARVRVSAYLHTNPLDPSSPPA